MHSSTWLYMTLLLFYHGSTWLYLILLHSTMASTWLNHTLPWLYYILPWLYLSLLDSTTLYLPAVIASMPREYRMRQPVWSHGTPSPYHENGNERGSAIFRGILRYNTQSNCEISLHALAVGKTWRLDSHTQSSAANSKSSLVINLSQENVMVGVGTVEVTVAAQPELNLKTKL